MKPTLSDEIARECAPLSSKRRYGVPRLGARGPSPGFGGRPLKGTEGKTLQATRPWEAEGISQATWYRRRREEKGR